MSKTRWAISKPISSFEADRQARAMLEQMKQAAGMQALQSRGMQLQAAGAMGDMAALRQRMEMDRLNQMLMAGGMERGLLQQGLDIGYQDFLRQQSYPMEMLSLYSNYLQGAGIQPGQTTSVYGQQPSTGQQLAGLGIAGLGMYQGARGG
jgi:hypothetical protein